MRVKIIGLDLTSLLIAVLFSLSLVIAPGCATRRTVTTTTEPTVSSNTDDTTPPTATETTTTTTDNDHDSVLGATGHFIWTVASFPFRLVGDAFELLV